ncbi:MAG: hypothetical protein M0Z82_09835 [Actinomycetota bacterium]|jgi:hypothetical protein|nr:hypothetical protein [Actinomycetota bacterium]
MTSSIANGAVVFEASTTTRPEGVSQVGQFQVEVERPGPGGSAGGRR